ncbi:MAG: hypothetical protein IV100_27405 [Myxococcales bacterium]|nr:hypothetical protein [Myxococcales bacterium]
MTTPWRQALAFVLLLASCSLEPNPSPYPMPGGPDVVLPGRQDIMAGVADTATFPDVSAPDLDVQVGEDTSGGDAVDGGPGDTVDWDVADWDVADWDVADELDGTLGLDTVDELDAPDGAGGDVYVLEDDSDADVSELDVQSRLEAD